MPRRPRLLEPYAAYHVTARGNRRAAIFMDDADRAFFVALLRQATARHDWRCLAYCLLTNHYHLLVRTAADGLPAGMRRLNAIHAMAFNERHGLEGHVFQDRYGSKLVHTDEHLLGTVRYIARNPVRAGICRRAEDWPWSSYTVDVSGRRPIPGSEDVLELLHPAPDRARDRLRSFVDDASALR